MAKMGEEKKKQQNLITPVLPRIWSSPKLLVGMQNDVAT